MDPTKFPEEDTNFNIDRECNKDTMFIDSYARYEFYKILETFCYLQNSCELDPNKMIMNQTIEEGTNPVDLMDDRWETLDELDPEGKWYTK